MTKELGCYSGAEVRRPEWEWIGPKDEDRHGIKDG